MMVRERLKLIGMAGISLIVVLVSLHAAAAMAEMSTAGTQPVLGIPRMLVVIAADIVGVVACAGVALWLIRTAPSPAADAEDDGEKTGLGPADVLLSKTSVPIALLDDRFRYLAVSEAWSQQFAGGRTPIGQSFEAGFYDIPEDWTARMRASSEDAPFREERACLQDEDGNTHWVAIDCVSHRADGQQCSLYVVTARITDEIVSREEEIASLQSRFAVAVEGTNQGMWDWRDLNADEEWWSDRYYELLGYAPGEIESSVSQFREHLHPDDQQRTFGAMQSTFRLRTPFDVRYRLRTKTDGYRWFRGRAKVFRNTWGVAVRMAGSIEDIHDQVLAEEAVQRAREEVRLILDSLPQFVYYKDGNNRILNLNQKAADALGRSVLEVCGRPSEEFFPEADCKKWLEDDRAVLRSGEPWIGIDEEHPNADGSRSIIRTDKIPLQNADGEFDRVVAIATDITELVTAQRRASDAQLRLETLQGDSAETRRKDSGSGSGEPDTAAA